MKAILRKSYGSPDVLQLEEIDKPFVKDNELLIKIHATAATPGDCEIRRFDMPAWIWLPLRLYMGISKPRNPLLGTEVAGVVESVGKHVTQFKVGEHIYATTSMGFGAYAEYICMPENGEIAIKPVNISFEEAAVIPMGAINALHFMRKAKIKAGHKVLVYGAAGNIGTFAIQIAKYLGAEVTAVDSGAKLSMLTSVGADHVIDYTQQDFSQSGENYDVIFDVVGKTSFSRSLKSLNKKGLYIQAVPTLMLMLKAYWVSMTSDKEVILAMAQHKAEDLRYLKELIEAGQIKPSIDKTYTLEQMVEAHRYVESGLKKGHVAITVQH